MKLFNNNTFSTKSNNNLDSLSFLTVLGCLLTTVAINFASGHHAIADVNHNITTANVPDCNYRLTGAEHPTFWFYLPKTNAQQIILSIKEEGTNPYWQQSINLTGETGIIGIKLSDDAPTLEIGKNYQWEVILVGDDGSNAKKPVITNWIKRVDESKVIDSQSSAKTDINKTDV